MERIREVNDITVTPEAVAEVVRAGRWYSRLDIAEALGREKTTHVVNTIERAVRQGLIEKFPGMVGSRPGWVYGPVGQQPKLFDTEGF